MIFERTPIGSFYNPCILSTSGWLYVGANYKQPTSWIAQAGGPGEGSSPVVPEPGPQQCK